MTIIYGYFTVRKDNKTIIENFKNNYKTKVYLCFCDEILLNSYE